MSSSEQVRRLIQIGCGSMGKSWTKYAVERDDLQIVALVDLNEAAAQQFVEEFGLQCPVFHDLSEALKQVEADLVFDVTIPEARTTVVRQALEAGCHVFSEKPMAPSMQEAKELLALSVRTGRSYAVMQNRRYAREIRQARHLLEQDVIGRPGMATAQFFLGPHFGGFREAMAHPLLLDMAIHTFDQARYLLQADPVSVYCQAFNPPYSWYDGAACAVCIFEMSDGTVFTYSGSWCAEGVPTSWQGDWRIVGAKGTLIWDGHQAPYCEAWEEEAEPGFFRPTKRVEALAPQQEAEGHEACFDEMLDALQAGRRAETDSSDNIKSLAMVFSAIESAERGEKIQIVW